MNKIHCIIILITMALFLACDNSAAKMRQEELLRHQEDQKQYYNLGDEAFRDKDYRKALEMYKSAYDAYPDGPLAGAAKNHINGTQEIISNRQSPYEKVLDRLSLAPRIKPGYYDGNPNEFDSNYLNKEIQVIGEVWSISGNVCVVGKAPGGGAATAFHCLFEGAVTSIYKGQQVRVGGTYVGYKNSGGDFGYLCVQNCKLLN